MEWRGLKSKFLNKIVGEPDFFISIKLLRSGSPNINHELFNSPARGKEGGGKMRRKGERKAESICFTSYFPISFPPPPCQIMILEI
jgi:hypothetical protein